MSKPLGVLGGTFDPVHKGHTGLAEDVFRLCDLDELRFIPLLNPPHRQQPEATPEQRLHMLHLAVDGHDGFVIDERELDRGGVSYTVDTLRSLRQELASQPLCLVMGADAFLSLHSWKDWKDILQLAHLVVVGRPGVELVPENKELNAVYNARRTVNFSDLHDKPAGKIFFTELIERDVSSSAIRANIDDENALREMLCEVVYSYIKKEGLYHRH